MFQKRRLLAVLASAAFFGSVFFWTSTPVNSEGTFTLQGEITGTVGLYGSPNFSLSGGGPSYSGAVEYTEQTDTPGTPGAFTGSADFGNLASGDGTPVVFSTGLRERGNVVCHVSTAVTSYGTNGNLNYNGTPLAGASGSELTFVELSAQMAGTQGTNSNSSAASINTTNFPSSATSSATMAALNGGTIAAGGATTSSTELVTFSSAPSTSGGLSSSSNWVEETVSYSLPTGFIWTLNTANGTGTGTFSVAIQYEIFTGP